MKRALVALARRDLRGIAREPFLMLLASVPILIAVLLRFGLPPLERVVEQAAGWPLASYRPAVVGLVVVIIPLLGGALSGLQLLDELDDNTLVALRVSPLAFGGYLSYRTAMAAGYSGVSVALVLPTTGLVTAPAPTLLLVALTAGVWGALPTLSLGVFARDKVEGMALMKIASLPLLLPLLFNTTESGWRLILLAIPTAWPLQTLWAAETGGRTWPWVVGGVVLNTGLLAWLLRRARRRLRTAAGPAVGSRVRVAS